MPRTLKLMADYHCWALWGAGDDIGNIDPATLPLTEDTRRALASWIERYDQTLDWSDPGNSPPMPVEFWESFRAEGRQLLHRLREELGPGFTVVGHPPHVAVD